MFEKSTIWLLLSWTSSVYIQFRWTLHLWFSMKVLLTSSEKSYFIPLLYLIDQSQTIFATTSIHHQLVVSELHFLWYKSAWSVYLIICDENRNETNRWVKWQGFKLGKYSWQFWIILVRHVEIWMEFAVL